MSEQKQQEKPLLERLGDIVIKLHDHTYTYEEGDDESFPDEEMMELVADLDAIREELANEWAQASTDGQVPTVAQGIALARFLRPHFNSSRNHWGAFVSRGGAGLGNNYLHVRLNDGYEGGIDRDGHVSTWQKIRTKP